MFRIPLMKPFFDEEMRIAAIGALCNERLVLGESVYKFEEEFAAYCGSDFAISTNSGTAALHLSLIALGVEHAHDVITTPYSFIATANVILYVNANPVFVDIDIETYTIDPNLVNEKITKKTKAVMPVHLYGYPAEMDLLMEAAEKNNLKVVEDACQAHGAEYKGRKMGTIGDVGCFSFYPSKNMTVCGDGGIAITNDEKIAKIITKLRDCGRETKYSHDIIGYTARLNTVNAAIGRIQLKRLDEWNEKRRRNATSYNRLLRDIDDIVLPPNGKTNLKPVFHLYVIRSKYRNHLKDWLEKNGVECGVNYPIPIHLQPIYRKLFNYQEGDYPESELLSKTCLCLPMYPDLKEEEIKFTCEKIHEFYKCKE